MQSFSKRIGRALDRLMPGWGPARCSSCGNTHTDGLRLIAGPRVYLCSDCITRAMQPLGPVHLPATASDCRFCGRLRPSAEVTVTGTVAVCADCLGRMEAMLRRAACVSQ